MRYGYEKPKLALVSAGPWQGLYAMASAHRDPITGVWVQGAELNAFFILRVQRKPQICHITDRMNIAKQRFTQGLRSAGLGASATALGKGPPSPCLGPAL